VCTDDTAACGSVREALRLAGAGLDYLNAPEAGAMDHAALGEVLTALGDLQGKLAAAHAAFLRRFDAAGAHDADGYGSSSAWLAAKGRMTRRDARAAVRQMRQFSERPGLHDAVATGDLSRSWAVAIADWTRKLPAAMRDETDKILLQAAAAGATLEDLATIAGLAIEKWRSQRPDPEDDEDRFRDRYLKLGTTFGGAALLRADLTPECGAAVTAVLEALGNAGAGKSSSIPTGRSKHAAPMADRCCGAMLPGNRAPDNGMRTILPVLPCDRMRRWASAARSNG
jgi:Domain of unknown function (DUF222)